MEKQIKYADPLAKSKEEKLNHDSNKKMYKMRDIKDMKQKIFSREKKSDVASCGEIYKEIRDKIQAKIKTESDSRSSFITKFEMQLKSLEEEVEVNLNEDKEMYAELVKVLNNRNILLRKLMKKLNTAQESTGKFIESLQSRENLQDVQKEKILNDLKGKISAFKTTVPGLIQQEDIAKKIALQAILTMFEDGTF